MKCPKCNNEEIIYSKVQRQFKLNGNTKKLKRYTCLSCYHKFDFN